VQAALDAELSKCQQQLAEALEGAEASRKELLAVRAAAEQAQQDRSADATAKEKEAIEKAAEAKDDAEAAAAALAEAVAQAADLAETQARDLSAILAYLTHVLGDALAAQGETAGGAAGAEDSGDGSKGASARASTKEDRGALAGSKEEGDEEDADIPMHIRTISKRLHARPDRPWPAVLRGVSATLSSAGSSAGSEPVTPMTPLTPAAGYDGAEVETRAGRFEPQKTISQVYRAPAALLTDAMRSSEASSPGATCESGSDAALSCSDVEVSVQAMHVLRKVKHLVALSRRQTLEACQVGVVRGRDWIGFRVRVRG
jgi:hypothetical protein